MTSLRRVGQVPGGGVGGGGRRRPLLLAPLQADRAHSSHLCAREWRAARVMSSPSCASCIPACGCISPCRGCISTVDPTSAHTWLYSTAVETRIFHCSPTAFHAEHTALSRPTDAHVLPQPLSASPGVYAAQTNKKELMVTAEQLQARHATEIHPRCSRDAAAVPPPTLLSHTHRAHTALSPRAPGLAL